MPARAVYLQRQSVVLGVVLIVLALLSAVFNVVDLAITLQVLAPRGYGYQFAVIGHGLWAGALVRIDIQPTRYGCMDYAIFVRFASYSSIQL